MMNDARFMRARSEAFPRPLSDRLRQKMMSSKLICWVRLNFFFCGAAYGCQASSKIHLPHNFSYVLLLRITNLIKFSRFREQYEKLETLQLSSLSFAFDIFHAQTATVNKENDSVTSLGEGKMEQHFAKKKS